MRGLMPTPLHMKPPTAAWIARERRRLKLKPRDVAARLGAMGLEVAEATVKVWESNADRRPAPWNVEGLERIFESKAPERGSSASGETGALVSALQAQTQVIGNLVAVMTLWLKAELVGRGKAPRLADLDFDTSPEAIEEKVAWMERSLREQRGFEEDQEQSVPRETVG